MRHALTTLALAACSAALALGNNPTDAVAMWLQHQDQPTLSVQATANGTVFIFIDHAATLTDSHARALLEALNTHLGTTMHVPPLALVFRTSLDPGVPARIVTLDPERTPSLQAHPLPVFLGAHAHERFDTHGLDAGTLRDFTRQQRSGSRAITVTPVGPSPSRPQGRPNTCDYTSTPTRTRYICYNASGQATYENTCTITRAGDTYSSSCTTRRW